jgi:hypothetical protein
MLQDIGGGNGNRIQALIEARCAWCGPVPLARPALEAHVGRGGDALLEFACPVCRRSNLRPLSGRDVAALRWFGVAGGDGPAPFELLEEHAGPPITWDDLIDFHQAMERHAA